MEISKRYNSFSCKKLLTSWFSRPFYPGKLYMNLTYGVQIIHKSKELNLAAVIDMELNALVDPVLNA